MAALTGFGNTDESPLAAVSDDGKTLVSISKKCEGLVLDLGKVK